MRGEQEEPDRFGIVLGEEFLDRGRPLRTGQLVGLLRFLGRGQIGGLVTLLIVSPPHLARRAAGLHQAVVHPIPCERFSRAAFRLGQFVLVMRKHQVETAAVNVDRIAEDLLRHRGTFDVPARPARSPRAVPRRLAGLGALPQGEVGGMMLAAVSLRARPGQHLGQAAAAQLAVVLVLRAVEVDVTVERIGVALPDQRADDLLHLLDVLRRIGSVIDPIDTDLDAHRLEVVEVVLSHLLRQGFDGRLLFVRAVDQLVVDIRDVDDPCHLVTAVSQIPLDRVEDDRPDHVPDVSRLVDRRPAQIHLHLPRFDRLKIFLGPCERVVNAKRHSVGPS